ncbi:MAG: ribosome maturation factor RimM [Gammaproteobacteria bacterium]
MAEDEFIYLGHINGVFGVKGWVKVFSDTRPRENIFSYSPIWLQTCEGWREYKVISARSQGKGLVAQFENLSSREQAELLVNYKIGIKPEQLPETGKNEYYWSDLIGLEVLNTSGEVFGKVIELLESNAHDVLVVKNEQQQHLIPYVTGVYVLKVDLEAGSIEVDWQQDYST